ncbi:MAG: hypothetical protein U0237_00055 [Thermoleophilia bacterium]
MSATRHARRARLLPVLLAGLALAAFGGGSALAQSPSAGPDTSVTFQAPASIPPDSGATPAVPNPAVTGAQPVPFDHIEVAPDGRTLTIYYWYGAEGCYGLKQVDTAVTDQGVVVTIWAGMLPEAINRMCIDIAQLYSTQVVLDQPVFVNGGQD